MAWPFRGPVTSQVRSGAWESSADAAEVLPVKAAGGSGGPALLSRRGPPSGHGSRGRGPPSRHSSGGPPPPGPHAVVALLTSALNFVSRRRTTTGAARREASASGQATRAPSTSATSTSCG
ncbi:hypothetical protein SAMN05216499_11077 [Actinacidiphila paucisporea]|uniref:Uncharacterized protein n=1 Tax=Actinacidiphila paucisporea TaxID=310782 RepID=A0A1M7HXC1_9ACTN|nr:hypothetical protein SAMN05216499_11077 [Actinacidiphila paucisporea]